MNYPSIQLDWPEFKSYLDTNLCSFKQLLRNNTYYLYLSDGPLIASCLINKNGNDDQVEYELSYQAKANKPFLYYSIPVNIRQTAATAANATVFAMRNPSASTRTIVIESIVLSMSFDAATPLARSLQRYYFSGFNTATPTGGTTQNAASSHSSNPSSQITDIRYLDTGLTTTNVVFGSALGGIGCPASDAATSQLNIKDAKIVLLPGEGFAIRLAVAAVAGQGLTGMIQWSER